MDLLHRRLKINSNQNASGVEEQHRVNDDLKTVEVPDDTLGLHELYPLKGDEHADLDVVFLHGIGGDSFSTWTHKKSNVMWPAQFLPNLARFRNSRIMTFGYNSKVWITPFNHATSERLFTFGEELMNALRDHRVEPHQQCRPLILVGHSLGGLVIKSGLVYGKQNSALYGKIIESTKSLVFFGTPHQGADVATWGTYLTSVSKAIGIKSSTVLGELKRWSPTLLELNRLFSEQISDLQVTTFFELEDTNGVRVVHEGSARLSNMKWEVTQGLHRNHISICKFARADESDFHKVKARFQAIAADIMKDAVGTSPTVTVRGTIAESSMDAQGDEEQDDQLHKRLAALQAPAPF